MKKRIIIISTALIAIIIVSQAYAGKLSVLERFKDKGDLAANSQYGESIRVAVKNDKTTLNVEDIFRDGLQTKIAFTITNIDIKEPDEFSPEPRLTDNQGNVYGKCKVEYQYDKEQKIVSGVIEFAPIIDSKVTSFELYLRDNTTNLEWNVKFPVNPKKVGPQSKKYLVNKSAVINNKAVEILEIDIAPSAATIYLNSEVGLRWGRVKDDKGNTVAELKQGFAPLEKKSNWSHEWTFEPVPEMKDLVLEINTKSGEILEIPFKL
ncbi:MAG: hypothetical protein M0021_04330 [Clostridia bacterium]|nr:hypothetical protein [Clostridia bacterium]